MINTMLKNATYAVPYTPSPSPAPTTASSRRRPMKHLLQPPTTTSATNYESWWSLMEVSLRQSFPVLSSRLRDKLTVRVGRTDHVVYSDALYKLETKTKAEEEKMSQSEKDVMKTTQLLHT